MMISNMLLRVLLLLIVSTYAIADCGSYWDHVITVDGVNSTHNDTMCINGDLPCATLNMALKGIKNNYLDSVCIDVKPGNYTLEFGEENKLNDGNSGITEIAIIGSGMNETVINCEPSAGLCIMVENQVRIDSISFHGCGYCCYNDSAGLQLAPTAITILGSATYTITYTINNVALYNSIGSGILMINMYDDDYALSSDEFVNVTITNSLITGGFTAEGMNPSKILGGVIVILSYNKEDKNDRVTNSMTVLISHSNITSNKYFDGAAVTVLEIDSSTTENDFIWWHMNIDSCFITENKKGLLYDSYIYDSAKVPQHTNVTINITNTQLSSLSNTSVIEIMPEHMLLQFDFIDVNITDILKVSLKEGKSTDLGQCYKEVLTAAKSCSKHRTCHFPEFDLDLHYDDYDYIKGPGVCSDNCIMEYPKGHRCPVPYSVEYANGIYSCWGNHHGKLCGKCIDDHSVAINSPYLACVHCNDMTVLKGWGLLIVLEFIPVTVMVAVIAVLNVNLNQGSLKAYIFFCQILTIPFPSVSYPSWFVTAYNYENRIVNIPLVFLAIWNLGFISYPSCNIDDVPWDIETICDKYFSICISNKTTALGAISFWYLIAFYPFILLFLLYLCVLAYDKGFHCVVCVMRPVHRLLARFWRKFNIQPSLPHTIASVYTLCFTQLAATSLKLLHFTIYDNQLRFFYDGSQRYFSGWHGAAGTLALIVLIVFIIVPGVYLSVYPFMWFQKCLNKVKIKKDLLISVTDVFTAPYSDGTQDTWDYRYYTSSHFILQLLVMVLYYIPSHHYSTVILALQICLCSLFVISLVVFRPYKRKIHVFTETILLLALMVSSITGLVINILDDDDGYLGFYFIYVVIVYSTGTLFFLISFCFCCVWFTRKCYKRQRVTRRRPQEVIIAEDDDDPNDQSEDDALLADRLVNPSDYHSMSLN